MTKIIQILIFAVLSLVIIVPSSAEAGWLEFFFPSLAVKEPDPSETLQAPFAADPNTEGPAAAPGTSLPVNAVPLDKPHRSVTTVGEWVQGVLPEIMTIAGADYKAELEKTAPYFDKIGRQEFMTFLQEKGIQRVLDSKRFHVRGFVQDVPFLLNEGELDGSYRWLFEIPVMVTYLDSSMVDYKNADPVSQRIILTVQAGRSHQAQNSEGLLIERWSGKVQKIDKK